MKKVLVSQLISGLMKEDNFANHLSSAIATGAREEDLLVYLTLGIPTKVILKNSREIISRLSSMNSSYQNINSLEISAVDTPENRITVHFNASVIRWFKDEQSAEKSGRYGGQSKESIENPIPKTIEFSESETFDIDSLEEWGAIEVIRRR